MSTTLNSTTLSPARWVSPPAPVARWLDWPRLAADALHTVREPLRWVIAPGRRAPVATVAGVLHAAARGPADDAWAPPPWLLPHQVDAARRIAGSLGAFRGALLADATGLGKTYVALGVATRYARTTVAAPATLLPQWRRVAQRLGVAITVISLESVSRGATLPAAELLVVDEAHHLRNPATRRYDAISRHAPAGHLLLLTATPVANSARDLVALLRLFLADNALAPLGVPSLERDLEARRYPGIARVAAAVCVARTAATIPGPAVVMPQPADVVIRDAPVLSGQQMPLVLAAIEDLRFPAIGQDPAPLLRLHLLHRLTSSVSALRETVGRHLVYLSRAMDAAGRGESLSRGAARALFSPDDDGQLSLDLCGAPGSLDTTAFAAERERLERLAALLAPAGAPCEKALALERVLAARRGEKTIVFTTARVTALMLARRLGWQRVAVASAAGARIASGAVPLEDALTAFAPRARGATPPPRAAVIDTLIATDLVSEGLDLQDADAIVHYDLPWTPLRLAQRLGRISRLGGAHVSVGVWWFLPPAALEARLRLGERIHRKAEMQRALGGAGSSAVGRARMVEGELHWRECLAAMGRPQPAAGDPVHAVVRGPSSAAFALRWAWDHIAVPELLVLNAAGQPAASFRTWHDAALTLCDGEATAGPAPESAFDRLRDVVRLRLHQSAGPAANVAARRLARALVRRARRAARRRDVSALDELDAALTRVHRGLPTGAERALAQVLARRAVPGALRRWLRQYPDGPSGPCMVTLDAALIGAPSGPPAPGSSSASAPV